MGGTLIHPKVILILAEIKVNNSGLMVEKLVLNPDWTDSPEDLRDG